jgi:hypothetical protein
VNTLQLKEMTYGHPTELLAQAAHDGARIVAVPVSYEMRRAGVS